MKRIANEEASPKGKDSRSNMVSCRRKRRSTFGIHDRIPHLRDYRHWTEGVNRAGT